MLQWYGDSVLQWYGDSVLNWYCDSVLQWYGDSVLQWYGDSVLHWYCFWVFAPFGSGTCCWCLRKILCLPLPSQILRSSSKTSNTKPTARRCSGPTAWSVLPALKKLTESLKQNPSWETNRFSASQEILRVIWNPKVHYGIHNNPQNFPIPSPINPLLSPALTDFQYKAIKWRHNVYHFI